MDDTISSAGISPTNVMDDTNDDYTPEELAVVLGMYVRQLLLGSNTIRVQNALCHMFRDLECEPTSDDCEKLSVELLKFGMSRDVEEIKDFFAQQMIDYEDRINEAVPAENVEPTSVDFKKLHSDCQLWGLDRDEHEIRNFFFQWMIDCENRINEGVSAEDDDASEDDDSEEASGGDDNKIVSKL